MDLILHIDESSAEPPYRQIADAIRNEIENGNLRPGQHLPSARELGESLSFSRLTVRRSYELLAAQGYLKIFSRGNTFVSKLIPNAELVSASTSLPAVQSEYYPLTANLSPFGERLLDLPEASLEFEGESYCGAPRLEDLPVKQWRACLRQAADAIGSELLFYDNDAFGLLSLREAIRELLSRSRGIACSTEQIVVFSSTEGGFDLLTRILLSDRDFVASEDPGFCGIWKSFQVGNSQIEVIPVDENGLLVDQLHSLKPSPKMIYVTPSSQDPTGVVMSAERRAQLLAWATENSAWILEDDFDSEFKYGEGISPALQSIDGSGVVIYRYNFWKSLYPLLRMGFLVLPLSLVPVFRRAQNLLHRDVPLVEQSALASLISSGQFEKHLRICQKTYARKRASLFFALSKEFAEDVSISRTTTGTNLLVKFAPQLDEGAITKAAMLAEIPLYSTRESYFKALRPRNEFLLSFVGIKEAQIEPRISKFKNLCYGL